MLLEVLLVAWAYAAPPPATPAAPAAGGFTPDESLAKHWKAEESGFRALARRECKEECADSGVACLCRDLRASTFSTGRIGDLPARIIRVDLTRETPQRIKEFSVYALASYAVSDERAGSPDASDVSPYRHRHLCRTMASLEGDLRYLACSGEKTSGWSSTPFVRKRPSDAKSLPEAARALGYTGALPALEP